MAIKISKNKLLLVEGSHEKDFFTKLLETMEIDDIQTEPVGGKYSFKPNINNLPKYPNFDIVKSIGIVRDADTDFKGTFESVRDALREGGFPVPDKPMIPTGDNPSVAVFIMPDNGNKGALEELCIESIREDPVLECVEQYFDCLKLIQDKEHLHLSKAQVQVYLAKEPDGDIHMGIASQRDIWQWNSPVFNEIKEFIKSL